MWKRLQQNKAGRQQGFGDGPHYDNTLGGVPYGGVVQAGFVNIEPSAQDDTARIQSTRPPREPPKGLPHLPFQPAQVPPQQAGNRPPSSIYSLPSPTLPHSRLPRNNTVARAYRDQVQISPPSSPETAAFGSKNGPFAHGAGVSPEISPVDELPDVSKLEIGHPTSRSGSRAAGPNIPMLRREKRQNQIGVAASSLPTKKDANYGDDLRNKKTTDTRWDTLTGEPTTSERGRPPQVKPSEFTPPIYNIAEERGLGLPTTGASAAKGQSSFGDRVKKLKENKMVPGGRPEWKGSSGRSQIVSPVADQVTNQPVLHIPRKSSKRATSPRSLSSGESTPVSVILGLAETATVAPPASGYTIPIRKPLSPPQEKQGSPPHFSTSPISFSPQPSVIPIESLKTPTVDKSEPPNQFTTPASSQPLRSWSEDNNAQLKRKDSISSIERKFREALKDVNFPKQSREQPTSRFSVTTYATSTADSTPRVSIEEPPSMPTPPREITPIVNRRRPLASSSVDSTKATARKAVPTNPVFISMSARDSLTWRNSKMLPKSPPEAESGDLITSLQAQLDNLGHRRANLQKSIYQMTQLMPSDPLARGMEARRQAEEKKKVEMLREDLDDVIREEHEIGLRLHRAFKRKDATSVYEPTGLWVRRVTG